VIEKNFAVNLAPPVMELTAVWWWLNGGDTTVIGRGMKKRLFRQLEEDLYAKSESAHVIFGKF